MTKWSPRQPTVTLFLLALPACLSACTLVTQREPLPAYTGVQRVMLILDMTNANGSVGSILQEVALNSSDFRARFKVVDRSTIKVLLNDQQLASVGLVDSTGLAAIGKQAGFNVVLKSNLNYLQTKSNTAGNAKYGYSTYYTGDAEVSMSILDVETGQVLATATGRGSGYDSSRDGEALRTQTFRKALDNGLYNLMRMYSKTGG